MRLEKCPFCGGEARLDIKHSRGEANRLKYTYYVGCANCHARGPTAKSMDRIERSARDRCVSMWNEVKSNGNGETA